MEDNILRNVTLAYDPEMECMTLYHAGLEPIPAPDLLCGRKNADFGQGFYLSDSREFSVTWSKWRKGKVPLINRYELRLEGLRVKEFTYNSEWMHYLFLNRAGAADIFQDYDVIVGPIANDTIFDIWGVITCGILSERQALKLLATSPNYEQIVIKSQKAIEALHWTGAEAVSEAEYAQRRAEVRRIEEDFQIRVTDILANILKEQD